MATDISEDTERFVLPGGVEVHKDIATKLKQHQKEAVIFVWNRLKPNLANTDTNEGGEEEEEEEATGAVISHHMGLGKTFSTIAFLHTVINNPSIALKTALVVVPSNVIYIWRDEIDKWTIPTKDKLQFVDYTGCSKSIRKNQIENWMENGGLLIMTHTLFSQKTTKGYLERCSVDILVVDEARLVLKNPSTAAAKSLQNISTKRRILLTGTPLQNNVREYLDLVQYACPEILGNMSKREFQKQYREPIENGMFKDCEESQQALSNEKQKELHVKLGACVHRRDATILREELPELHVWRVKMRQGWAKSYLIKHFQQHCEEKKEKNFLKLYGRTKPILKHPDYVFDWDGHGSEWIQESLAKTAPEYQQSALGTSASPKLTSLAHVLVISYQIDEKVVVYSDSTKTLDRLEEMLQVDDWQTEVPSLSSCLHEKFGGYKKGKDYLRIDGSVSSENRGEIVTNFNTTESIRVILISMEAGGIGINLTGATRVVHLDSHFNPAVLAQCDARSWRLGQEKPVHVYKFVTANSMDTKVDNELKTNLSYQAVLLMERTRTGTLPRTNATASMK